MRILILTTVENMQDLELALQNGASGYLLKNIAPDDLISSIRVIMDGDLIITSAFASKFISKAIDTDPNRKDLPTERPSWIEELSEREREILLLTIQGLSCKEIAASISIGEQTVRNYLSKIYSVMEVNSRKEAVSKAKSLYLLDRQFLSLC
jgi:DNA-binding NarL/FixJ family response regulator